MAAVEVRDLVVRYGDRAAVDGVSLDVEPGEIVALLGPNGAGKTSTVEAVEGYRAIAGGQVRVLGKDPRADRRTLVPRIGVMLQRGGVYPSMGARRVLALFASYYDDPADPDELLELVGIGDDVAGTPWRRLSGGEQQRVSLALALVGRPEVAFLDEPSAGVDVDGRVRIREVIGGLRSRGVAVLLTTHDLDDAQRLADRVVIVDDGRVVAAGTPDDLRRAAGGDVLRFGARAGLDVGALGAAVGGVAREEAAGEYVVEAAPTPAAVARLTAWLAERDLPLADLRAGRGSLEDVFRRATADAAATAEQPPLRARRRR